MGIALLSIIFIRPNPQSAWWLTASQKEAMITVLKAAHRRHGNDGAFSWAEVLRLFKTPFALLLSTSSFCVGIIPFGLSYFLPS